MENKFKYIFRLVLLLSFFIYNGISFGQIDNPDYEKIKRELANGNKQILRDVFCHTLLSSRQKNQLLDKFTFFTSTELPNKINSDTLLQFYYNNESFIKYSPIIKGFYITPLESQKSNFSLKNTNNLDKTKALQYNQHELDIESRSKYYSKIFSTPQSCFKDFIDYLGFISKKSDSNLPLQIEIINDLTNSKDPKSLFYLAAIYWRNNQSYKKEIRDIIIYNLEVLLQKKIPYNELITKDWIIFWASNYSKYEYDRDRGYFIKIEDWVDIRNNYNKLFKRLNSSNDSIAIESFKLLASSDPIEISRLNKKYKDFIRSLNHNIPDLSINILPVLCNLNSYLNSIKYDKSISDKKYFILENLQKSDISIKSRIEFENELIHLSELKDITIYEINALLNYTNSAYNYSIARIINHLYNLNWDNIISNNKEMELFLKKIYLFKELKALGFYKNLSQKLISQKNILDITKQLNIKIDLNSFTLKEKFILSDTIYPSDINALLSIIITGNKKAIRSTPFLKSKNLSKLVNKIIERNDTKLIKSLGYYLYYHADTSSTDIIYRLFLDSSIFPIIKKKLIGTIDGLFNYNFTKEEFLSYYPIYKDDLKQLSYILYLKNINKLKRDTSYSYKLVNNIITSDFFKEEDLETITNNLSRLKPLKHLRFLKCKSCFEQKLLTSKFNSTKYKSKIIPSIINLLEIDDINLFLKYILAFYNKNDIQDFSKSITEVFQKPEVINGLIYGKIEKRTIESYIKIIEHNIESGLINDYDLSFLHQDLFLLKNSKKPIKDILQNYLLFSEEYPESSNLGHSIFSQLNIEDIASIFKVLPAIENISSIFINHDLGIPIYNFSPSSMKDLSENITKMKRLDLYRYYISEIFPCLFENDKPNFNAIYKSLKLDLVGPYIGKNSEPRDLYSYSIVKYLEYYFNENLGFQEKLNESQFFYSYNSSKRIRAWIDYFERNKIVNIKAISSLNKSLN